MRSDERAPMVAQQQALPVQRDLSASHAGVFGGLAAALAGLERPLSAPEIGRLWAKVDWESVSLGEAAHAAPQCYVRTLIFRNDHAELLVMTWLPGQRSAIHDHAGSVCAVRVMEGVAMERRYLRAGGGLVEACNHIELLSEGATTLSVDDDVHALGNAWGRDAPLERRLVTVHLYSPPLRAMRRYSERR